MLSHDGTIEQLRPPVAIQYKHEPEIIISSIKDAQHEAIALIKMI